MSKDARSSSGAAFAGFLVGSAATAAISFLLLKTREERTQRRRHVVTTESPKQLPTELRDEQLSRHTLYFEKEGMDRLKNANVLVVGLGGVGSHAAHMLARGGVSYLRIIDFDQVTLSSLNRHACATLSHVGTPKATCLKAFLEQICPDKRYFEVEAISEMYTADNGESLFAGRDWDIVIDAIDDVPTKAALLAQCIQKNIRVISCMGAGGKSDFTRLHVSDLKTASRDPLASKLRTQLKRLLPDTHVDYLGDMDLVAVIYSSEKTVMKLADFTPEQKEEGVHKFGAVDNMRIRVLPVLGTMPAIMGQSLAALALCELGNKPFSPVAGERVGKNVRHRLLQHLKRREKKIKDDVEAGLDTTPDPTDDGCIIDGKWVGPVQIDTDDVEYLLEVWRNRCAVTGDRLGTVLELARWDVSKPSTCGNLVLMSARAIQQFDSKGLASIPRHVQIKIETRLASFRTDAYTY